LKELLQIGAGKIHFFAEEPDLFIKSDKARAMYVLALISMSCHRTMRMSMVVWEIEEIEEMY
jgi:hypothetical protein